MIIIRRYTIDYSLKNGLGKPAVSIYLTGCDKPIKCDDCHNWELQEESKEQYDIKKMKERIDKYIKDFFKFHKSLHVSILGGEPLAEYNRKITYEISKYIKEKYPNSTIIIYSWRTIDQIFKEGIKSYIKYIDYGVLGAYDKELYIENTIPSSTNQYIYDFKYDKINKPIILKKG